MRYAVIESGGKQFRVTQGELVTVPSISKQVGQSIEFDILLQSDGDELSVGTPVVDGTRVRATVIEHGRQRKIIVFKKKRRKQYKKVHGHRQGYTRIRIESIGGEAD